MWFTSTVRLLAFGKCFMSLTATSATGESAQCTETPLTKEVIKINGTQLVFSTKTPHMVTVIFLLLKIKCFASNESYLFKSSAERSEPKRQYNIFLEATVNMISVTLRFCTCLINKQPVT